MIPLSIAVAAEYQSWRLFALGIASAVLWFVLMALAQSAVQCIYQTAVYLYARDGRAPDGFDVDALGESGESGESVRLREAA